MKNRFIEKSVVIEQSSYRMLTNLLEQYEGRAENFENLQHR